MVRPAERWYSWGVNFKPPINPQPLMRRALTLILVIVVGALTLAMLTPSDAAHAQSSEPLAVYKVFMPMIADPTGSPRTADQTPASEVLALVNRERANAGCAPVTLDTRLSAAALAHSEDMARRNYFSHTAPDGTTFDERIEQAGYSWSTAAENIAAGQATPAQVMSAWMGSPGHKANILSCDFTQMGLGHYYEAGDRYGHYWTQNFAAPLQ